MQSNTAPPPPPRAPVLLQPCCLGSGKGSRGPVRLSLTGGTQRLLVKHFIVMLVSVLDGKPKTGAAVEHLLMKARSFPHNSAAIQLTLSSGGKDICLVWVNVQEEFEERTRTVLTCRQLIVKPTVRLISLCAW